MADDSGSFLIMYGVIMISLLLLKIFHVLAHFLIFALCPLLGKFGFCHKFISRTS